MKHTAVLSSAIVLILGTSHAGTLSTTNGGISAWMTIEEIGMSSSLVSATAELTDKGGVFILNNSSGDANGTAPAGASHFGTAGSDYGSLRLDGVDQGDNDFSLGFSSTGGIFYLNSLGEDLLSPGGPHNDSGIIATVGNPAALSASNVVGMDIDLSTFAANIVDGFFLRQLDLYPNQAYYDTTAYPANLRPESLVIETSGWALNYAPYQYQTFYTLDWQHTVLPEDNSSLYTGYIVDVHLEGILSIQNPALTEEELVDFYASNYGFSFQDDVYTAPVPLPPAPLLFLGGIVTLIGIARKKQRR